jgi:hypothetical protein
LNCKKYLKAQLALIRRRGESSSLRSAAQEQFEIFDWLGSGKRENSLSK